jgi:hypothetical protein
MLDKQTFILIMEQTPLFDRKRVFVRHSKKGNSACETIPQTGFLVCHKQTNYVSALPLAKGLSLFSKRINMLETRLCWAVELE